ncbi:unnamed protein product [Tilletia controversa]|uniref:PNPLA domain-containing protein n=3 Tax=Tilletia TaxID=13289 RepID=A0A8X7ML39_9BASI|nr:hypothetical protein CF336_g7849 [Tilletia laevis]KAE8185313.1 hypothetical protein CF328_g7585 [Tilletia controversa]KAE8246322.1 hypothetical protein A4X03_0g7280 [Tilletia caries]KAE8185859.1 hypothetical protein CF335_g7608 [Tilletia laevis]KAE8239339.1 hypothetical protein A4X06_0g8329 [Tilletia controversa]
MSSSLQDRRSPVKHMRLRNLRGSSAKNRAGAAQQPSDDDDGGERAPKASRPDITYTRQQVRGQVRQAQREELKHKLAPGGQLQPHQHRNLDEDPSAEPRSPGGGAWSTSYDSKEPHPLVTEVFPEPQHIAAFAEALRVDLGQQDVISPQLLLYDDHSAIQSPRRGFMSPREERHSAAQSASFASALWQRLSSSRSDRDRPVPSSQPPSRDGAQTPSPLDKDASTQPGRSAQANADSSLNSERQNKTLLSAGRSDEPSLTRTSHPRNVGRISAASDFAPVHERVQKRSKRRRKTVDSGTREGLLYQLLRFPLLVVIFLLIAIEFGLYVFVRQLVNVIEYALAFRGRKGRLRKNLRAARTWDEWKTAALKLDQYLGLQRWKEEDASGLYDWILIKKVVASLRTHRSKGDADKLMEVLELCLKNNFAGVENFKLFSHTYFGSKNLVERFTTEAEESLRFIHNTDKVSIDEKRQFYRRVAKNMGKSALCLSGGGSFGYYHVGVVRALLDARLLPTIVSGTSAGGLIAALACTRTDEELKELLVPALADRISACEEPIRIWAVRAYKTGARFDTVAWASKASFFTRGSMTFMEAYQRTGKILNVSVIPADRHSPVKLLNHMTAPNCIIWSALLASAAVPGLLNPVCLMQKTKDGEAIPYNLGHRFKDGSLRVDIPLEELHALFRVNYPIVSQVNPHIHLFHFAPQGTPGRPVAHRQGRGWRGGFVLSAVEHVLKLHLAMNFKIIRDLDLLPRLLGTDWSSVFLQRFTGAVTIIPRTRFRDWLRILSDPDRKELARMLRISQSVTFPKLHMIENRVRLENAVEAGRRACRRAARLRQLEEGGSTPVTPSEGNGRPTLVALPSYIGSDTDHDDLFNAFKTRPGKGEGRGAQVRLRELQDVDDSFEDGTQANGASTSDERDGAMQQRGLNYRRAAGTDEEGGTSEDGDHKLTGVITPIRRPTWLDRGDGLNSDDEDADIEESERPARTNNTPSNGDGPQTETRRGARTRTWSIARASAAFRNTFSPNKAGSSSPGIADGDRLAAPHDVNQDRLDIEDETSSGEDEAEI